MKKFINFFRNLSVSWKFVLAYFSILIVPVFLMGIYLYNQNSATAIKQARLVMEQNLLQTKAGILQKGKVIEQLVEYLAEEQNFQNFLTSFYKNDIYRTEDYQFRFSDNLRNILRQNDDIFSIRIFMKNIFITEMHTSSSALFSFTCVRAADSPELYSQMLKYMPSKGGWISTHTSIPYIYSMNTYSPKYSSNVFSFSRGIYITNYQKNFGVLNFEVKESSLFSMLRDSFMSKLGKVFIVDSENRIVSNNLPNLFMKDTSKTGLGNFNINTPISTVKKIENERSIFIVIPIENFNCSIVGIFPVSNFNSEVKKSLFKIVAVLAIPSVFLGIIIYFTTNLLLRRMKKMVKAMKQVRQENLDVTVPVKVMDEFGELALTFNHMTSRIHELVEMVYKIQILEREAELKAWEAQINPHFLYNTLATISFAARKSGSQEIVRISNSLAKFYRLVLSKGNSLILVSEELDMVSAFLQIQKIRFQEMFDVEYSIGENVHDISVIKNILQPIVENALNHGIEPKRMHGTLLIKAWNDETNLFFQVIDDGVGMSKQTIKNILSGNVERSRGSGYAIKNILERLRAYYGANYSFDIFSKPGIGTVVTITLTLSE